MIIFLLSYIFPGVCIKSLTQFFTNIQDSESDECDDDANDLNIAA